MSFIYRRILQVMVSALLVFGWISIYEPLGLLGFIATYCDLLRQIQGEILRYVLMQLYSL